MAGSPLYDETVTRLRLDPFHTARHRLTGHDANTEEIPVGKHGDDDLDGVANQSDQDWRPDARDAHAHDDDACDPDQTQPDRWVGVTRDPDWLPVAPSTTAGEETTWRGDRA